MFLNKHAVNRTFTGSSGALLWRTPGGLIFRASSPSKILSLDVLAFTDMNPSGNAGIKRVYFEIVPNGGATIFRQAGAPSLRFPKHYEYSGSLPGADTAGPTPFFGYGYDLDLATMDGGYLDITARIETKSGNFGTSSTIRVFNDTDGINRQPSQRVCYLDQVNGSPTGLGTLADPVSTMEVALWRCIPNRSLSTAAARNAGGARIIVMSDLTGLDGGSTSQFHTGPHHLIIKAGGGVRRTFRTLTPGVRTVADQLRGACWDGMETNITFEGFDIEGLGFYVEKTGGASATMTLRDVNCRSTSAFAVAGRPSVTSTTDDGQPTEASDSTGTVKESWGHQRTGCASGLLGYSRLHDFTIENPISEALDSTTASFCFTEGLISGLKSAPGEIAGWQDVTGGTNFQITVPQAGTMRIQSIGGGHPDFALEFANLIGDASWGLKVSGATNGANDLSAATVTGVGYDSNGRPYVEVANGSAVAETMTVSGRIRTARLVDGVAFDAAYDPTVFNVKAAVSGAGLGAVRFQDCSGVKGIDLSGFSVTRLGFIDFADGSQPSLPEALVHNFGSTSLTHCQIQNSTLSSEEISFAAVSFTGTGVLDSVFGFGPATFPTGFVSGCHFVSGTAYGIYPTTGPFFQGEPGIDRDGLDPLATQQRTATQSRQNIRHWDHSGPRPSLADWVER